MRHVWILAATALVAPSLANAQTGTTNPQQGQIPAQAGQQRAGTTAGQTLSAADFVTKAAIGNQFEIQSSELARDRIRSDQVRQFADRMIRDHRAAGDRLKTAAGNRTVPSRLDEAHQQKLEQIRSAGENRTDRVYIDLQVQAHRDTVAMFDRYVQNGDDPRLKQFAQQSLPSLREHLQSAEQVQGTLRQDQVGAAQGRANDPDRQQTESSQQQVGTDASRIVVQQPAPSVRVDQASPTVTVQQPQPNVTVRQPQPEIVVRQPQPTVTVDIPQPEIVVRMPEPDVNVSMAEPQVQVNQPPPQVQVAQPDRQAQVQVERSAPQVRVERSNQGEAKVTVQRADQQPNVRYERAEPRVVVNQARGEPQVRYERLAEGQQAQGRQVEGQQRQAQAPQPQPQANNPAVPTDPSRMTPAEMRERAEVTGDRADDPARTSQATGAGPAGRAIVASELMDMNLYNARGDELGDVERVVVGTRGDHHIVIGAGGFLGIGERDVAIPLDRVAVRGDRLVIRGVTEDQIRTMPAFERNAAGFRDVLGTQTIQVGEMR